MLLSPIRCHDQVKKQDEEERKRFIQLEQLIYKKFIQEFENMIKNGRIKDYDMWWLFSQLLEGYAMHLDEQFETDLHNECYKFIQLESNTEDFFLKKNWDLYDDIGHKYLIGYRKLFEFKSHFFQLRVLYNYHCETVSFTPCLLGYIDECLSVTHLLPDNRLKIPKKLHVEDT